MFPRFAPKSRRRAAFLLGSLLLVLWATGWAVSLTRGRLLGGERTWVPVHDTLGIDLAGPCQATRHRLAGGNPYREPFGDPLGRPHIYPPLAFVEFAWAVVVPDRLAYPLWWGLLCALAATATGAALRARRLLGLSEIPLPLALAAIAWSTPLLFALERGNSDLVAVGLIVAAAAALRRGSFGGDLLGGSFLALAAWLKIYPGLLLLALPFLRYPRAAALGLASAVLIGLAAPADGAEWLYAVRHFSGNTDIAFVPSAHPLSTYWRRLFAGNTLHVLTAVPGIMAATGLLVPPALGVSGLIGRRAVAGPLLLPCFLWLTALATFIPPASNDYNLLVLPLAILASWDRDAPWYVHLLVLPVLLWWQPVRLAFVAPKLIFGLKLAALAGVGVALALRARALSAEAHPTEALLVNPIQGS